MQRERKREEQQKGKKKKKEVLWQKRNLLVGDSGLFCRLQPVHCGRVLKDIWILKEANTRTPVGRSVTDPP
jgi:hypothetical protein